jgi:L-threonylcarbamoyladenylate synthase
VTALITQRWKLQRASAAIHSGGVIAYPTEAVFGLGCDPLNPTAVAHLLAVKHRPIQKGLILIASCLQQLQPFIAPLSNNDLALLKKSWPGPHTWLLPARAETPYWLRGEHQSVAVRVTAHPLAAALCESSGHALVSTSANPAGRPPARQTLQVHKYFHRQIDYILSGDTGNTPSPTCIRDLRSQKLIRA